MAAKLPFIRHILVWSYMCILAGSDQGKAAAVKGYISLAQVQGRWQVYPFSVEFCSWFSELFCAPEEQGLNIKLQKDTKHKRI